MTTLRSASGVGDRPATAELHTGPTDTDPAVAGVCTAKRFSDHDHSLPPHNTPATAKPSLSSQVCQANSSRFDWEPQTRPCTDTRDYEIVVYQSGTHEWVRMFTCTHCALILFFRHSERGGPKGTRGIAWIRDIYREVS